jgi:hypothetical protein
MTTLGEASSMRVANECVATAEHHRVDRANARARQHRKRGLGNHGHVNQNAVAFDHAKVSQQDRGHALHFCAQVFVGVSFFLFCLSGYKNQCGLIAAIFEMPIYRVVAQIGGAADKPPGEGRVGVIANLLGLDLPIHGFGFVQPKKLSRSSIERL